MATKNASGAAKSKKSGAKVGGEFGGLGGVFVVGGVLAVGVAAGAIAVLRRRRNFNGTRLHDDVSGKMSENSSGNCDEPEVKPAAPTSENVEEIEPVGEIADMQLAVERFSSVLDSLGDGKNVNRPKDEDSPRSHFSLTASNGASASMSSDSEDLTDIAQSIYRVNSKDGSFTHMEESARNGSFDFNGARESGVDTDSVFVEELVDSKVEYEESVDSFDGLEESEKGGEYVELGSEEQPNGGRELGIIERWDGVGGKEAGECSLGCRENLGAEMSVDFVSGDGGRGSIDLEKDGSPCAKQLDLPLEGIDTEGPEVTHREDGSPCVKQLDLPLEGIDAEGPEVAHREDGSFEVSGLKDIVGLQISEPVKDRANSKQDIALFKNDRLRVKGGGSEDVTCDEEKCSQDVVYSNNEEKYKGDCGRCDENGHHGELEDSKDSLFPIKEEGYNELVSGQIEVHQKERQQEIVGANEDVILCEEQSSQEEQSKSNVEQCRQARIDSEELEDSKVDEPHEGKQFQNGEVDSRDFEGLYYKGRVNNYDEIGKREDLENIEQNFCPLKNHCLHETVQLKELRSPQERNDSGEDQKDCKVSVGHKSEQLQHETVDSRGFEGLEYNGGVSHCDEKDQELEDLEETLCSEKEQSQQDTAQSNELELKEVEMNGNRDGHEIGDAIKEALSCNEQCLQEENFESNVEQRPLERIGSEKSEDCMVDAPHEGEQYHYQAVDSGESKGLEYSRGVNHYDEIGQHGELKDSEENFCPLQEQNLQETVQSKELECTKVEVNVDQDGHQYKVASANEEVLLCKEQCGKGEEFESKVEQCLQERTDTKNSLEDYMVDVAPKDENHQNGAVDSMVLKGLEEDKSHENGSCQHGTDVLTELEYLKTGIHIKKAQFEDERLNSKEDVDVHVVPEENFHLQEENLREQEEDLKAGVHIEKEQFEDERLNPKEDVDLQVGLEEKLHLQEENLREQEEALENTSVIKVQHEEKTVNSNEINGGGDTCISQEHLQAKIVDSKESQNSVNGILVNHELCKEITSESKELDFVKEGKPVVQEECKHERVDSVEIQDSVKVHYEENITDSKEIKDVEGDELIFKEQPQEEVIDSKESQNSIEDVKHEQCPEIRSEHEELEDKEESMPLVQKESKDEKVDSIALQDSVEDIPVENKQCQREIGESDQLDDVSSPGEKCPEKAVDSEQSELSDNVHSHSEPCHEEESVGEFSSSNQSEMDDPKETDDLENVKLAVDIHGKESVYSNGNVLELTSENVKLAEDIHGKESGYSNGTALELTSDETVDHDDNEDPQTYIKSEEADSKASEYSSGDTSCFKEKHQQEAVDEMLNEDYKQDTQVFHEQEEVHEDNSEDSSTHTHLLSDQKEVNGDTSSTVSNSCKLHGDPKGLELDDGLVNGSTGSETNTNLQSEPIGLSVPNSVTKSLNNGLNPLHSSEGVSKPKEEESILIQPQWPHSTRTRIIVSIFVAFLAFFFALKIAKISTAISAL